MRKEIVIVAVIACLGWMSVHSQGVLEPVNGQLPQNPHGYDPGQVSCVQCHVIGGATNNVPNDVDSPSDRE